MGVQIESLAKSFGAVDVLKSITQTFAESEISVLLGSSGCGKTTTLRCIAGLERPTGGSVTISGRRVSSVTPNVWVPIEQRRISMVFQSYAIWPHMTVAENVSLPLKAAGVPRPDIARRVKQTLDIVGLGAMADRSATQLSGGQQQRVALARCVVSDSPVILMDEPFSNLDASLRVAMRAEVKELQQKLNRTVLFVTHDQEEALSLADTVFLFRNGDVVQKGAPRDIYDHPASRYVAEFLGKANILASDAPAERIAALIGDGAPYVAAGQSLCIRPEKVAIVGPGKDTLPGRIEFAMFMGDRSEYRVVTALGPMTVIETNLVSRKAGDEVGLRVRASDARVVDDGN